MKQALNKIPLISDFYIVLSSPIDSNELKRKEAAGEKENNSINFSSYDVFTLITNKLIGESIRRNSQGRNIATSSF